MVRTLTRNGNSSSVITSQGKNLTTQPPINPEDKTGEEQEEQEEKEPINWIRKSPVAVRNLPLSPEVLDGEVQYTTTKGNITILDQRYACFRIGSLLSDLGFTIEDVGSEALAAFTEDALRYYLEEYPKEVAAIEAEKLEGQRDAVLAKAIPQFKKMSALLGFSDRLTWTDDQWIDFISKQA